MTQTWHHVSAIHIVTSRVQAAIGDRTPGQQPEQVSAAVLTADQSRSSALQLPLRSFINHGTGNAFDASFSQTLHTFPTII